MDKLFVGVTRPAMKWGVTMDAIIVGGMLASIGLIGTGNPLALLLYLPVHGAMFLVCMKDPNIISLYRLAIQTKGKATLRNILKASSSSPAINTRRFKRFRK